MATRRRRCKYVRVRGHRRRMCKKGKRWVFAKETRKKGARKRKGTKRKCRYGVVKRGPRKGRCLKAKRAKR